MVLSCFGLPCLKGVLPKRELQRKAAGQDRRVGVGPLADACSDADIGSLFSGSEVNSAENVSDHLWALDPGKQKLIGMAWSTCPQTKKYTSRISYSTRFRHSCSRQSKYQRIRRVHPQVQWVARPISLTYPKDTPSEAETGGSLPRAILILLTSHPGI